MLFTDSTDIDKAVDETLQPLRVVVDFISGVGLYIVGVVIVISLIAFIYAQKSEKAEMRDKAKTSLIASVIILGILFALPTIFKILGVG